MENGSGSGGGKGGVERGPSSGPKKGKMAAKLGTKNPAGEPSRRGPGIARLEAMRMHDELRMLQSLTNNLRQQPTSGFLGTGGGGINGLLGNRIATDYSPLGSYQQQQPYGDYRPSFPNQNLSNYVGTIVVSNGQQQYYFQPHAAYGSEYYLVHQNTSMMPYGAGTGMNGHNNNNNNNNNNLLPVFIRPMGTAEAASYANPSDMPPTILPLFEETHDHSKEGEGESPYNGDLKGEEGHKQSEVDPVASTAAGKKKKDDSNDPDDLDLDLKL